MYEIYRHRQTGWLVLVSLGALLVLDLVILAKSSGNLSIPLAIAGMAVLFALLFGTLTVVVDRDTVSLSFGIGVIRKSFSLAAIRRAKVVRNRWYYGWGIRLTPHGWLFNVSGLDAVQIDLDDGRSYRIGTDDQDRLCNEIVRGVEMSKGAGVTD